MKVTDDKIIRPMNMNQIQVNCKCVQSQKHNGGNFCKILNNVKFNR